MLEIAMVELKKAAADFSRITGLKLVLYNEDREVIYTYPDKMCDFCVKVRQYESLKKGCLDCDNIGFDYCEKLKGPYIYSCHMGLDEAIAPIYENDVIIGYLMIGQILCAENYNTTTEKILETTAKYDIPCEEFLGMLGKMPCKDREFINSCVNIMSMCASYLYFNKIIKNKADIVSAQIKEYINSHLCDTLSVGSLCERFHISKTTLYNIAVKNFGMGIKEYIRDTRLERAKQLLLSSEKSVQDVAKEAGYKDCNYFTRYFGKTVGVTPREFRKQNKGEV